MNLELSLELLQLIDSVRGNKSRQAFIKNYLKENLQNNSAQQGANNDNTGTVLPDQQSTM